jgi:hypothetical protein
MACEPDGSQVVSEFRRDRGRHRKGSEIVTAGKQTLPRISVSRAARSSDLLHIETSITRERRGGRLARSRHWGTLIRSSSTANIPLYRGEVRGETACLGHFASPAANRRPER